MWTKIDEEAKECGDAWTWTMKAQSMKKLQHRHVSMALQPHHGRRLG